MARACSSGTYACLPQAHQCHSLSRLVRLTYCQIVVVVVVVVVVFVFVVVVVDVVVVVVVVFVAVYNWFYVAAEQCVGKPNSDIRPELGDV